MRKEVRIKSLKSGNYEINAINFDLVFKTKKSFENWFKNLKPSKNSKNQTINSLIKAIYRKTQTYYTSCPDFNKVCEIKFSKKEKSINNEISENTKFMQQIQKDNILIEIVRNFDADLQNAMPKIRQIIIKEDITKRLNGDLSTNEICNRAVGLVGYHYAKHLGWLTILRNINKKY